MKKILFDTDVLIEHLRNNPEVTRQIGHLYESGISMAYTPVSEAEILQGLRSPERERTVRVLGFFECLNLTRDVGRQAGEYLRKYSKSHGLEIADSLIAAAAVVHRFALCTFNWKHYPMSEIIRFRIE